MRGGSGPRLGSSDRKSLTVLIVSILFPRSLSPSTSTDDYLFKYIIVGDTGAVKEMNVRNNALVGLVVEY